MSDCRGRLKSSATYHSSSLIRLFSGLPNSPSSMRKMRNLFCKFNTTSLLLDLDAPTFSLRMLTCKQQNSKQ